MAYLLLLAFVCSASFAYLSINSAKKSTLQWALFAGFGLQALSLLTQLVLGFHLDESNAKLFYLSRLMLAPAWLGFAALTLLLPKKIDAGKLIGLLILISLLALALVGATQMTRATDWYRTDAPVYSQINDLFATNRPTRWLAAGLEVVGLATLTISSLYLASRKPARPRALLLLAAVGLLSWPILWPPLALSSTFFITEALIPFLLFFGFLGLQSAQAKKSKRRAN